MGCSCSPTSLTADTCNAALGVNQSCMDIFEHQPYQARNSGRHGGVHAQYGTPPLCFTIYSVLFIKCHSQWTKHVYCMFAEQIEHLTLYMEPLFIVTRASCKRRYYSEISFQIVNWRVNLEHTQQKYIVATLILLFIAIFNLPFHILLKLCKRHIYALTAIIYLSTKITNLLSSKRAF